MPCPPTCGPGRGTPGHMTGPDAGDQGPPVDPNYLQYLLLHSEASTLDALIKAMERVELENEAAQLADELARSMLISLLEGLGLGPNALPGGTGSSTSQSWQDWLNSARQEAERQIQEFIDEDSNVRPPPINIDPNYIGNKYVDFPQYNVTELGGYKGHNIANTQNQDPCNGSAAFVQSTNLPSPINPLDPMGSDLSKTAYNKGDANKQAMGVLFEQAMGSLFSNISSNFGSNDDAEQAFKDAVMSLPSGLSGEGEADWIVASLLGEDPTGIATLPPALVSAIDQLANDVSDPTGGSNSNIDWGALGAYLSAQRSAGAASRQAATLGGGGSFPCGDVESAYNNAQRNAHNDQQNANDLLKKVGGNLNPRPVPPLPSSWKGSGNTKNAKGKGNKAPAKKTAVPFTGRNPSTGVTSRVSQNTQGSTLHKAYTTGRLTTSIPVRTQSTITIKAGGRPNLPIKRMFSPDATGVRMDTVPSPFPIPEITYLNPTPLPGNPDYEARELLKFFNLTSTKLLDVITALLGSFVTNDPDPVYNIKLAGGTQLD